MKDVSRLINKSVWLLALAIVVAGCGHKTPEDQIEAAKKAQQQGDHKTAIVELKTALQQQPSHGEARFLLAQSLYLTGEMAGADKELKRARELGAPAEKLTPLYGKVLLALGENQRLINEIKPGPTLSATSLTVVHLDRFYAYQALKMQGEAMQALAEAEKTGPDHPELFLAKSRLARRDGNNDKALQLAEEALKRDPKLIGALYTQAELLGIEGKYDAAIKVYHQIVANDAKQIRAYLAMSSLHLQAKNLEAADQDIQAAEKINANMPMVKFARGNLELRRGKLDKASSALLDVLSVEPNHLPSALAYATASYGLGNYDQSLKSAGKVLGAFPDNLIAARILADSQLKLGDVKGALKTLGPLLIKFPNDARMLAIAGEAHLRAGDNNKAMAYLDKAAELDPENASIKTRQAAGHLASGKGNQAMADLEKAASLSDKPGQADLALVMMLLNGKEYDKALHSITILEKKLPNNPVTYNLRAAALLGKQDRAGARKALEQAIAIQPTFFPATFSLARMDSQENKPEAARERFKSILAQDKNNVKSMLALADLAKAEKKDKEFVDWLEKAIKTDPKVLPAYAGLIRYHLAKKENTKALSQARQAVSSNPESLDALDLLGTTQMDTGDIDASIATYMKMTQKAPQSPEAHLRLALTQISGKQLTPARNSLNKALQLKADFLKAQDALIRLELLDNKPEAALRVAREIQTSHPKSPIGFEREGDILLLQKRYPQVIKAYMQALSNGAGTTGQIKLHRVLFQTGDTKAADQRLAEWIKKYPKDVAARAYSAEVYLVSKRNREAIAQYEAVLGINPNHLLALNNLANLYLIEKDGRAISVAERALKLAPDHPGVQDTLGWILVENGQAARGVELLRKAIMKSPNADSMRYHFAVALSRTGNQRQAKQELDTLIRSKRSFPELENAKSLLSKL